MRILFLLFVIICNRDSRAQLGDPFLDANGKWGFKLKDGKVFVPATYDLVLPWSSAGVAAVNIGRKEIVEKGKKRIIPGKWGLLHYTSGLVVPAEFDAIIPYFQDPYFLFNVGATVDSNGFMSGGKWGVMNRNTRKLLLDPLYDYIGDMDTKTGVIAVYQGGKYMYNGYVSMPEKNSKGKWALVSTSFTGAGVPLTEFVFHSIERDFYAGFKVRDAVTRKYGYYTTEGKKAIDCIYDTIGRFTWPDSLAWARKNGKYGFIRKDFREQVPFVYDQIADADFSKGFIIATRGETTYVVDKQGKELTDPPASIEQEFTRALAASNNSVDRGKALIAYDNALKAAGYSAGHCSYLMGKKFLQVVNIDFHGMYEYLTKQKGMTINFKGAMSALQPEQRAAVKALMQYSIDKFNADYNSGAQPAWPAMVPKPGYGWGKTVSSDRVVVTPVTTTAPAKPPVSKKELEAEFFGKTYIVYFKNYDAGPYGSSTISLMGQVKRIENENSILVYFRNNIPGSNQDWTFYSAADLRQMKTLKNRYVPCSYCGGSGLVTSTFKHTNDYSYTLGQKHIYTATSTQYCNKCCGGMVPAEPGAKCEW